MKNFKIKTSFVLIYDVIHEFLAWLRTGSNPADINRFRRHTRKLNVEFNFISVLSADKWNSELCKIILSLSK